MNKPTFTKGPWASDAWGCVVKGETLIANCRNSASEMRVKSPHEDHANARLIAAAPELFEALKAIYEIDVPDAEWSPTLEKCFGVALDAIAKVEGEK
jgi:hypothetical protein